MALTSSDGLNFTEMKDICKDSVITAVATLMSKGVRDKLSELLFYIPQEVWSL